MYKINKHPILDIGEKEKVRFSFEEKTPKYFDRLMLSGDGLPEKAFK